MAIKALRLDVEEAFTPECDPDKGTDAASVFQLGTLDARVFARILDGQTTYAVAIDGDRMETHSHANDVSFQLAQFALRGWKNVRDHNDNDIVFKTVKRTLGPKSYTVADPDTLVRLPTQVIMEIGNKVRAQHELTEEERKN